MAKHKSNKLSGMISGGAGPGPSAAPYKESAQERKERARYRAEDDLRTLQRAQEIHRDRERMGMCKAVANEQMKALKGATGAKKRPSGR